LPTTFPLDITGPGSVYLLLIFGFLALIVVTVLIALIEGVVLTLLKWNHFRASIIVSLIMNVASGIINGVLLVLLQHSPLLWLPISFVLSILIEGIILMYFRRDATRQNWLFVLIVNLASYFILILPAYYYGTRA
jgi:hypothetical protein